MSRPTLIAGRRPAGRVLAAGALALALLLSLAGTASAGDNLYWLVNVHSGKALMPNNHSTIENWWIKQRTFFHGSGGAHHWKIRGDGSTSIVFENRHSHMCISSVDHEAHHPLAANGTPIIQRGCNPDSWAYSRAQAQTWRIVSRADMWAGKPFTLRNVRNNRCLEMPGWTRAEDADAGLYDCHGYANQQWRLVYAGRSG